MRVVAHASNVRPGALAPVPVHLSKTLSIPLGAEQLSLRYTLQNKGQSRLQTHFAIEWNIHLLGGGGNDSAYYRIDGQAQSHFDSTGEVPDVSAFQIGNTWLAQDIHFDLSQPATLWRFSIETVTGSEAGFERNHQGSCLTLLWPIELEPQQCWNIQINCTGKETS